MITQRGDVVMISGDELRLVYRGVLALALRRHRDGVSSADLTELRIVLYRAAMSQQRHPLDESTPTPACCEGHDSDLVDSAAAAEILHVSRRTVQRLTGSGRLLGVRAGSIWLYRKDVVMGLARERKAAL